MTPAPFNTGERLRYVEQSMNPLQRNRFFRSHRALCGLCLFAFACAGKSKQTAAPEVLSPPPIAAVVTETPAHATPPPPTADDEPLALHMRDHIDLATQARDALIRGRLVDATAPLTWIAQHKEPKVSAAQQPFYGQLAHAAQRAIDGSDLRATSEAVGELAAACGECHSTLGGGPKLEPSGFEELEVPLSLATHMRGYAWATDTLWDSLISGRADLWDAGVSALRTLVPPARPRRLAAGFASIRKWAKDTGAATSSRQRAQAFGDLIATCGGCHVANAVDQGAAKQ